MTPELLIDLGLHKSQAAVYLKLITNGELSPPEVAKLTGESRTNSYNVLGQLEKLELVEKVENKGKVAYRASNPVALEKIGEQQRKQFAEIEQKVKSSMPALLSYFYSFTERPGVRLFQGADDLKEVYKDVLRTGKKLYLLRSVQDKNVLGEEFMEKFIKDRVKAGIEVEAITPEHRDANQSKEQDRQWLFDRTWVPEEMYDEPLEISIYGDRVALVAFGEEVMGVLIQSPVIANSFRSIFKIMQQSLTSDGSLGEQP